MKVGDEVKIKNMPELGSGKIVRFYANQGTVLVDFKNSDTLKYCDYCKVMKEKEE